MDRSTIVFLTVLSVVIVGSVGVVFAFAALLDWEEEYDITYDLAGGVNSPDNPSTYKHGDKIELCDPTREGYIFEGWYDSKGNLVLRIDPLMKGDIKLTATWSQNLVGRVIQYNVEGTINSEQMSSPFFPPLVTVLSEVTGTYTMSYLSYDLDKGYEMQVDLDFDYSNEEFPDQTTTNVYWTGEQENTGTWSPPTEQFIEYEGSLTPCVVYTYTESTVLDGTTYQETQYIVEDWLLCKIEMRSLISKEANVSAYQELTFLVDSVTTDNDGRQFDLQVYGDEGISVNGTGTYDVFSSITLTATVSPGTQFVGWYSESGRLLSTSQQCRVFAITGDMVIFAANDDRRDVELVAAEAETLTRNYGMEDCEWTLTSDDSGDLIYESTGPIFNYEFTVPGIYTLKCMGELDGVKTGKYLTVFADGDMTKSFTWKDNDDIERSVSIDILYSDYLAYAESDVPRGTQSYKDINGKVHYQDDLVYVTYNDKYIVELAQQFDSKYGSLGDAKLLEIILTFTQNIPYQLDSEYKGQEEYWKFPVETLFENGGDCEDTSILYSSIVRALGYDTALLLFSGHMAAAVSYDGQPTGYSEFVGDDGKSYLFCETTYPGWEIGQISDASYTPASCLIVMVVPDQDDA